MNKYTHINNNKKKMYIYTFTFQIVLLIIYLFLLSPNNVPHFIFLYGIQSNLPSMETRYVERWSGFTVLGPLGEGCLGTRGWGTPGELEG